ncbi:hypothetical protein ACVGVM_24305 [Pseudonocardia bannensis]|uniref:DUF4878 domain-containing protein n=1 Tax=Pseudonocardia bannensis TaxID=630973 RepID=A0A848DFX8_9PSEU|nr:hypothetical protein [Pseudonocardia bannensis]NMH91560.1 hypothetical protein [Pseudonocardia bannensis]
MTDPHEPEQSAGEESSGRDRPPVQSQDGAGEGTRRQTPSAEVQHTETEDTQVQGASAAGRKEGRKALLLGLGGGLVVAAFVLAAFVWPGFLAGPGKPDDKAAEAVAALSSKNPGELEKVSCHGPDGKPVAQLPPQALQLIQAVKQTGPPQLSLDTQALAPVDLTLSAQGQTQDLPVDVVLGVTNGEWCMNGISQRQ